MAVVAAFWAYLKIREAFDRDSEEWEATLRRLREVTPSEDES
jgi:hypothetical protein